MLARTGYPALLTPNHKLQGSHSSWDDEFSFIVPRHGMNWRHKRDKKINKWASAIAHSLVQHGLTVSSILSSALERESGAVCQGARRITCVGASDWDVADVGSRVKIGVVCVGAGVCFVEKREFWVTLLLLQRKLLNYPYAYRLSSAGYIHKIGGVAKWGAKNGFFFGVKRSGVNPVFRPSSSTIDRPLSTLETSSTYGIDR